MPTLNTNETLYGSRVFQYWYSTGPGGSSTTNGIPSSSYSSSKSGNWDRKRPTPLTPSPYTRSVSKWTNMKGSIEGKSGFGDFRRYSGQFNGSHPYTWEQADERVRLRNEAMLDALSNLKDQKFNAGVALAEAKGTAQLATDIGKTIAALRSGLRKDPSEVYDLFRKKFPEAKSFKSFKDEMGKSLNRADRLSSVPQSWLYYHFGIKPTMQDLDGIHQEWFARHASTPENFISVVFGKARHVVPLEQEVPYDMLRCSMKFVDDQRVRTRLSVQLRNGYLARLAQLGGSNIPEALWNGVPYTWVVDYFTSMGDWLHALDAGMGYDFGVVVESYRRKVSADANHFWNSTNPSAPYGAALVSRAHRYRRVELVRTIPVTLYPPMYRTLPMVKLKGPTVRNFANMLSVLSSVFTGREPRGRI